MQAGIGNVAAGSLFAAAQSLAMGGAMSTVVTAVGAGVGGVGGLVAAGAAANATSLLPILNTVL
jgi:hypothetical protein